MVNRYSDWLLISRAHCADEDSKGLMRVFNKFHQEKGISSQVYMEKLDELQEIYFKSVFFLKDSKEIKNIVKHLGEHLGSDSEEFLLTNISAEFKIFNSFVTSSPLFNFIQEPASVKMEVAGYCVSHGYEKKDTRKKVNRGRGTSGIRASSRTLITVACHIGNVYFLLTHQIEEAAKSKLSLKGKGNKRTKGSKIKRNKESKKESLISCGQPLTVTIIVDSTNSVKVIIDNVRLML